MVVVLCFGVICHLSDDVVVWIGVIGDASDDGGCMSEGDWSSE